jgi:hypothetical protein
LVVEKKKVVLPDPIVESVVEKVVEPDYEEGIDYGYSPESEPEFWDDNADYKEFKED